MQAQRQQLISEDTLRQLIAARSSHRKLALAARCNRSMIGHLVAGRTVHITTALAQRIANALDVEITDLFRPVPLRWPVQHERGDSTDDGQGEQAA